MSISIFSFSHLTQNFPKLELSPDEKQQRETAMCVQRKIHPPGRSNLERIMLLSYNLESEGDIKILIATDLKIFKSKEYDETLKKY